MKQRQSASTLEKVYIGILLIIFGGIVLHAPLSVGLGVLWPDYSLFIKSWKEILMLIAGLVLLYLLYKTKQFKLLRDPVIIAIAAYALLHVLLLAYAPQGLTASLAGLAIDLRYVLYFALIYLAMRLYPNYRRMFIRIGIAGALLVVIFAILQVFVLPHDVLKYIGYSTDTISPYLTVDQNHDFIRINSTMRGPNSLGAYIVIVLSLVVAAIAKLKKAREKRPLAVAIVLLIGGILALWSSYSRSALIAAAIAIGIVLTVAIFRKFSTKMWIIAGAAILMIFGTLAMTADSAFISNVFLHENPSNVDGVSSNAGHVSSLEYSFNQALHQPLGAGIGSTGSASLYTSNPLIIENQYLFIAHETGWLGLLLFVSIFVMILIKLWSCKRDWFALGVFAGGIGIAVIAMVLPILVDDTVAIIWWGLAALALFPNDKDYN